MEKYILFRKIRVRGTRVGGAGGEGKGRRRSENCLDYSCSCGRRKERKERSWGRQGGHGDGGSGGDMAVNIYREWPCWLRRYGDNGSVSGDGMVEMVLVATVMVVEKAMIVISAVMEALWHGSGAGGRAVVVLVRGASTVAD